MAPEVCLASLCVAEPLVGLVPTATFLAQPAFFCGPTHRALSPSLSTGPPFNCTRLYLDSWLCIPLLATLPLPGAYLTVLALRELPPAQGLDSNN